MAEKSRSIRDMVTAIAEGVKMLLVPALKVSQKLMISLQINSKPQVFGTSP